MSYQSPAPHYPPPPAPTKPAGLAIASLVLGIVGCVLSYMPIVNNISAAGAVVGLVLGVVGLWRSRPVMSLIGGFLSGVAVILTVLAQQQLSDELDKIGDDLDASLSSVSTSSSPLETTTSKAPAQPAKYTPTPEDWELDVVVTEQQCYGSAGCSVTLHVKLTYQAARFPAEDATYLLVYDVTGTEDALRGSTEITGMEYTIQDHFVSTSGPDAKITAKVVSVEPIG